MERIAINERYEHRAFKVESFRVVKEGYINATTVGTFKMNGFIATLCQTRLLKKIAEHSCILHLTQTHYGCASRALGSSHLSAQFADDLCHIAELGLILIFCPLVRSCGKKVVVFFSSIVIGVEKVFYIVESHSIE